jgi:hypothetical protein
MTLFARLLGAATAGYGAAVLASPVLLARPCELTSSGGETSDAVAVTARALGTRDVVCGIAMMTAPPGAALRWALLLRAGSDAADALAFGLGLPSRRARTKAALAATTWAALCGLAAAT